MQVVNLKWVAFQNTIQGLDAHSFITAHKSPSNFSSKRCTACWFFYQDSTDVFPPCIFLTPLLPQVGQGAGLQGEDLLGVFSTSISSTNNSPVDSSALCVFSLDELDRHIDSTRDLCYTKDGLVEGRGEVAYIEYEVKSSCANLPLVRMQMKMQIFWSSWTYDR